MAVTRADRKLMREMNSMRVLQMIRAHGPVSRPELADQTGLGLSTISNIVADLAESKLVREVGEGDSSGGRRPSLLDINDTAKYAFGVKIGPGRVWISMFDLRARQIIMEEILFKNNEAPELIFRDTACHIEQLRKAHRLQKKSILGIGVSTSGLINSDGVCMYSPILHWKSVPIKAFLESFTKLDVVVENDVNAFAFGSLLHDSPEKNVVCITTGPGVGAGIIVDRRLYRGSTGGAGEFGHTSIDKNGPPCPCGRRGCLDVLASDQFLITRAKELMESGEFVDSVIMQSINDSKDLSPELLLLAAQLGDDTAKSIYRELGENLGFGIANLINIFNPDKIVIGGEGAIASKFFLGPLKEVALNNAFPHVADNVHIVVDDGSEDVWLQGAASLVIDRFFQMPLSE